jgi:hypothetical protein
MAHVVKIALGEESVSTRITVGIDIDGTIYRFVHENNSLTVDGETYSAVPYAQFSPIVSSTGDVSDTCSIILESIYFTDGAGSNVGQQVIRDIMSYDLLKCPVQIGEVVLNTDTLEVIGLIPKFVGVVDNTPYSSTIEDDGVVKSEIKLSLISYRTLPKRRVPSFYSDVDHSRRFTNDRSLRHISDAVFRNGRYRWNTTTGGQGGVGGGSLPIDDPAVVRDIIARV